MSDCGTLKRSKRISKTRYSLFWGSANVGIEALPVQIEAFISPGLPKHTVVGLPRGAVRESLDRIFAAVMSSGLPVPRGAITINLAPAELKKESASFDLPVALALLTADASRRWKLRPADHVIMGELALDGSVRPVRGVLSMALRAKADGRNGIIVPRENVPEASILDRLDIFGVSSLAEAIRVMSGDPVVARTEPDHSQNIATSSPSVDFAQIVGHPVAKRALEIACTGRHHVMMSGPPGCGKTMLAKGVPGILPRLNREEAIEVTRIHTLSGSQSAPGISWIPPFRAPHHSLSYAGLIGGGSPLRPGEITLAHHGVLFLDELPEFSRNALESLRQPLEDGSVVLSRADSRVRFPSRFLLIAAMNPCPCGRWGTQLACRCAPAARIRYQNRISGPLVDRIDLFLDLKPKIYSVESVSRQSAELSTAVAERILRTREFKRQRHEKASGRTGINSLRNNSIISPADLSRSALILIDEASRSLGLSLRAVDRMMRVARTISDMTEEMIVSESSIAEAIQFRKMDFLSYE